MLRPECMFILSGRTCYSYITLMIHTTLRLSVDCLVIAVNRYDRIGELFMAHKRMRWR